MERFLVENLFGPPTPMVASEIPATNLSEPFLLLRDIEPELIACYRIDREHVGTMVAEAVTYGCPAGIVFRMTLVGPGMRRSLWERVMPAGSSIGDMVAAYWRDPSVLAVRG